jgi:hypothetical protein
MVTFGQIPAKQGDVPFALDVAPDKRALTFTFSDLEIKVGGGKSPATTAARVAPFVLPLDGDDERAEIEFVVQGHIFTNEGATATVVCSVNGQTTVTDVPGEMEDSFVQKLTFAAEKPSVCRLCVFLLLGRDSKNADAEALLTVTSLDAEILPRPGAPRGRC